MDKVKNLFNKSNVVKLLMVITIAIIGLILAKYPLKVSNRTYTHQEKIKYQSLMNDTTIKQSFISLVESFHGCEIPVRVENSKNSKGVVKLTLYDNNNSVIKSKTYNLNKLIKRDFLALDFDTIKNSKFRTYGIVIETHNYNGNEKVELASNKLKMDSFKLDGVIGSNDYNLNMIMKGYKDNYYGVIIAIVVMSILLYNLFKSNMNTISDIMKFKTIQNKKNFRFALYSLEFIISLLLAFIVFKIIINVGYYGYFSVLKLIILYLLITALSFVVSVITYNNAKIKWEQLFLVITIPIGIAYLWFVMPNRTPDEFAHYVRAYKVSNGIFISNNNRVRVSNDIIKRNDDIEKYDELNYLLKQETNYNKTKYTTGPEGYISIMYLFSGVGVFIGKLFSLPYYVGYYLARLFNFIFFLIIGYLSIKIIPKFKAFLLVFLLNPMMLQQCTSVSADMILNVMSILFVSYVLKLYYKEEIITNKNIYILMLIGTLIALSKYLYSPLVLFSLILFPRLYKQNNKNIFVYIISLVIPVVIGIFWYIFATYGIKSFSKPTGYWAYTNLNFIMQLKNIIHNPLQYIEVLKNSIDLLNDSLVLQTFGSCLGRLDIGISKVITFIYMILLFFTVFVDKNRKSMSYFSKVLAFLVFISIWNLIFLGLYCSFTEVKGDVILGVQGRYFLPIIMPLLVLVPNGINIKLNNDKRVILIVLAFVHFAVLSTVILRFI